MSSSPDEDIANQVLGCGAILMAIAAVAIFLFVVLVKWIAR